MCTYLAKRGATYYFRRIIPAELRPAMGGKTEFMLSLRTKDREAAKRLIPAKTAATDKLLEQARKQGSLNRPESPAESNSSVPALWESAALESSLEAAEIASRAEFEREERQEARQADRDYWRSRMRFTTRELTQREAAVKDLLADKDFDLEIARNEIAHLRRSLAAAKAAGDPDLLARPVIDVQPTSSVQVSGPSGTDLSAIVKLWAAERKPTEKGKDTYLAVARWFDERVRSMPVSRIARRDVLAFKDKLVEEGQSAANIITKLSRLRTLLQWAVDNDYAKENAAASVRVRDTVQARNRRVEFDLAALNRIFASPVYAENARPAGGKGEAAYWLPLLALFTGARLEELGQLRPADIQKVAYPDDAGEDATGWFIHIREDAEEGLTLKNAASERDVPVHAELERLGFIRFVEAARKAGAERLFPRLRPNKYGRLTAKWGEWFGPYLRSDCRVTDRRMVFHSFRHTFKQYARHAGIDEGVQRQVMGHSSGDVADDYGSGYPLHRVVHGMSLYRVPGLHLPAAWQAT